MSKPGDKLRELILDQYGSVRAFADAVDIPEQTLYSILKKEFGRTSYSNCIKIIRELKLDPFLFGAGRLVKVDSSNTTTAVNLYKRIKFDGDAEALDGEEEFPIPSKLADKYPDAFLLEVRDEGMNKRYPKNCYVLIDPCPKVEFSGEPHAVVIGQSDATVRCATALNNGIRLEPDSTDPTFRPLEIDFDSVTEEAEVSVCGRVVWYCASI